MDNSDFDVELEREIEIPRLSKKAKKPFKVKIHAISAKRFTKLATGITGKDGQVQLDKAYDVNVALTLAGMVDPDMKNKELMEKLGCSTPGELLEKIFRPSEIGTIADTITELSGFGGDDVVTEVKN